MHEDMLTPNRVATALGISTNRVYQLFRAGAVPHVRRGCRIYVPRQAWLTWLADQNAQAMAAFQGGRDDE